MSATVLYDGYWAPSALRISNTTFTQNHARGKKYILLSTRRCSANEQDNVPDIELLNYLDEFLDGLFNILSDKKYAHIHILKQAAGLLVCTLATGGPHGLPCCAIGSTSAPCCFSARFPVSSLSPWK